MTTTTAMDAVACVITRVRLERITSAETYAQTLQLGILSALKDFLRQPALQGMVAMATLICSMSPPLLLSFLSAVVATSVECGLPVVLNAFPPVASNQVCWKWSLDRILRFQLLLYTLSAFFMLAV